MKQKRSKGLKVIRSIKQFLKLKLLIITNIIVLTIFLKDAYSSENFIVTTVNKIPITKKDVINRAKLFLFSIENKNDFKNLNNYYDQSLDSLIREKIIFALGSSEKLPPLLSGFGPTLIGLFAGCYLTSDIDEGKKQQNKGLQ